MKAILKKEPKEGVVLADVPIPKIGNHDVLIRIETTSICGTDMHLYLWDAWAQKTFPVPGVIGHEFLGTIVEVGSQVHSVRVGDRVSGEGHITCGQCYECRTGNRVLCPYTMGVGVNRQGCFAEYLSLPAENAFVIPPDISNDIASIFDPLGNAVHTALACNVVGEDVLITGAGPIGLMAIPIVKKAGARSVVITDMHEYRLQLARDLGADGVVNISKEDIRDTMDRLKISGFSLSLEMSGSPSALASAVQLARHGGNIVVLGIYSTNPSIDWHCVVFKMLKIQGIYGRKIFQTWYQTLHMLQSGLDVSSIITHRFPIDDFQKGFDAMLSKNCGKVVLDWIS